MKYLNQELSLIMKYILINDIDSNLIDLLELLLKLLTRSRDIIEYRKTIISLETIKIVPILLSKLESICQNSMKIVHFSSLKDPKDLLISMIIDIFKYFYSYDTLKIEENSKDDIFQEFSKQAINVIKIISFNITMEKNLALNLSIINSLLDFNFNELTFDSLFDFCVVSVNSKNNLDEILFEILFQRMPNLKEELIHRFLKNMTLHCQKNEYFLSRICDLSFFIFYFNAFLTDIFEKSRRFIYKLI